MLGVQTFLLALTVTASVLAGCMEVFQVRAAGQDIMGSAVPRGHAFLTFLAPGEVALCAAAATLLVLA